MFRVIDRVQHFLRRIFLRLSAAFATFARAAFRDPETPIDSANGLPGNAKPACPRK